jgi:hypothetical protein
MFCTCDMSLGCVCAVGWTHQCAHRSTFCVYPMLCFTCAVSLSLLPHLYKLRCCFSAGVTRLWMGFVCCAHVGGPNPGLPGRCWPGQISVHTCKYISIYLSIQVTRLWMGFVCCAHVGGPNPGLPGRCWPGQISVHTCNYLSIYLPFK